MNEQVDPAPIGGMTMSRRHALQDACKVFAAVAAVPFAGLVEAQVRGGPSSLPEAPAGEKSAADLPVSALMTRFSDYISEARSRPLPAAALESAKWALLDTLGAIVSGSQLIPGRAAIRFARENGGKPVSTVIGHLEASDPITAAMANGTMGHADETDDVGLGPWHPGCNVVPAALALGEKFDVGGAQFLRSIALGYDIGSRVMQAAGVKIAEFRAPTNSMGGIWGAAAAAICAAGLNQEETRWALAYTAQMCSGIDDFRRDPRHVEKAFMNGGMGARNGVTAVLLVKSGFDGVNDIMAGGVGFLSAYADTAKPDLLIDRLGEDFYVTRAFFKHWPTGGPIAAPLDALQALLKRQRIDARKIREIVVSYWSPGTITDNAGPPDVNLQHAVALMLADRRLTFRAIHDYGRIKDPEIVRLRSLIRVARREVGDAHQRTVIPMSAEEMARAVAIKEPPAIQITMADGTRFSQDSISPGPGTAEHPYTREWLVWKSRSLMAPVLGAARTDALIRHVLDLENAPNIRHLGPLLRANADDAPRLSDWPMERAL